MGVGHKSDKQILTSPISGIFVVTKEPTKLFVFLMHSSSFDLGFRSPAPGLPRRRYEVSSYHTVFSVFQSKWKTMNHGIRNLSTE